MKIALSLLVIAASASAFAPSNSNFGNARVALRMSDEEAPEAAEEVAEEPVVVEKASRRSGQSSLYRCHTIPRRENGLPRGERMG